MTSGRPAAAVVDMRNSQQVTNTNNVPTTATALQPSAANLKQDDEEAGPLFTGIMERKPLDAQKPLESASCDLDNPAETGSSNRRKKPSLFAQRKAAAALKKK